tara:strand:+ start:386 stop:955 length:570 start_codon:yes stop_codon:yes gene_type:complete
MKIHEVIITTCDMDDKHHIAPMGINIIDNEVIIKPFKPSKTLENLRETKSAIVNFVDDVRVFAGIVTGAKREWSLKKVSDRKVMRLTEASSHFTLQVNTETDDEIRPKILCNIIDKKIHKPFLGFNRAQFSVIEAAVLVSRLGRIPMNKINKEIEYLKIGLDKTAGNIELEAWSWIEEKIKSFEIKNDA